MHYYILGVIFYGVVSYFLHKLYDYSSMGMSQTLWSGMSIIGILLVGSYFFGEKIEGYEWLGMLVIVSGVVITQIKNISTGLCGT